MGDTPDSVNETPTAVRVYVTCSTTGCINYGRERELLLDPGTPVQCGPCAASIPEVEPEPTQPGTVTPG